MTDSDKDLTQRLRQYLNSKYEVTVCYNGLRDEAADRIEELEARNKELTLQLLATSGQAADALDKLTKALDALQLASAELLVIGVMGLHKTALTAANKAREVLAELEGEKKWVTI